MSKKKKKTGGRHKPAASDHPKKVRGSVPAKLRKVTSERASKETGKRKAKVPGVQGDLCKHRDNERESKVVAPAGSTPVTPVEDAKQDEGGESQTEDGQEKIQMHGEPENTAATGGNSTMIIGVRAGYTSVFTAMPRDKAGKLVLLPPDTVTTWTSTDVDHAPVAKNASDDTGLTVDVLCSSDAPTEGGFDLCCTSDLPDGGTVSQTVEVQFLPPIVYSEEKATGFHINQAI